MADFDAEGPEEKLVQEAEELMRQRRFPDAVSRYQDVRRQSPTDLWASLGYISALECAGQVGEAEQALEEIASSHRGSAPLHRFRHLFFVRREDLRRAASSHAALQLEMIEEGPEDQLADLYFNQGRYHEARSELERLLRDGVLDREEQQGVRASVLARIGACLRQSGEPEPARERLIAALALEPGNHWTLSELAEAERALGNVEQARRRYREALESNADDQWTRGHLAQLECEDGRIDEAVRLYDTIIAAEPKAAWAKVELAQVVAERDEKRAAELLASALDDDPAYPWAHAQLGNLARRAGRYDEARKHYQRAASAAPSASWILHEQADVCRHLGRMEEAYAHLEHARSHNPYDAVTYGYYADLLRHEGKHPPALTYLEKAVELDAAYTWAWREMAELKALAGRHDEAEQAYRRACDLEPGEAINDGLKAFLLRCQGRRDAAQPYLERAVEVQRDYLWAWREQIDYAFSLGRTEQAETLARRALVAIPDSVSLMTLLAEALRKQGKRREAGDVAAKGLELAGEVPQLWAIRAEIAAENGEFGEALRCVLRAIELDRSGEYQALHAQILLASGKEDEADAIVRTLVAAPHPVLAAFELAATLAERRNQPEQGVHWCDQALRGPFPGEPRLTARRARLALLVAKDPMARVAAVAPLAALFERPATMTPWRDVAQTYANAGQAVLARRAAHLHLGFASAADQGKAWLALAELELALGNLAEAQQALDQTLARDPDAIPALILGAVLGEQAGDLATAITRLERIDHLLREQVGDQADGAPEAVLHRQLAALHERAGRFAEAETVWQRLLTGRGPAALPHPPHQAEYCCYLLRRGRHVEAEALAVPLLPELVAVFPAATETQHLLKDLAVRRAERDGADAGVATLLAHDDILANGNRLILAQLALILDQIAVTKRQLDRVAENDPEHRQGRLLRVRLLAHTNQLVAAETLARTLWQAGRDDHESTALLAECLALQGRHLDALAVLDESATKTPLNRDCALVAALVALELHGETACLARLGRVPAGDSQAPTARVLAAAWPGTWAKVDAATPATCDDLRALPAFPAAAQHLAAALSRSGRHDLSGDLLLHVADAVIVRHADTGRRLLALAVPALIRCGRRRAAWTAAQRSGSLVALLRCCLP